MFVPSGTMNGSEKSETDLQTGGSSSADADVEKEFRDIDDQVRHAICVNNNSQPVSQFWVDKITYTLSI